jgi:hypothetical protein
MAQLDAEVPQQPNPSSGSGQEAVAEEAGAQHVVGLPGSKQQPAVAAAVDGGKLTSLDAVQPSGGGCWAALCSNGPPGAAYTAKDPAVRVRRSFGSVISTGGEEEGGSRSASLARSFLPFRDAWERLHGGGSYRHGSQAQQRAAHSASNDSGRHSSAGHKEDTGVVRRLRQSISGFVQSCKVSRCTQRQY